MSKSEITKEKILKAAEVEYSEKGIYGARVDAIAELAGVNKRMIYEYFGNKEELYKTILVKMYKRLSILEEEIATLDIDSVSAIKVFVNKYFLFLDENPSFVKMIMWENLNNADYLKQIDSSSHIKDSLMECIHKIVLKGKKEGVFREDVDEVQVALSLITFIFSYFSNRHTLSIVLNFDFIKKENIHKRATYISNLILNSLLQ